MDKENVEDIVALTPLQEGLLFHYRSDKDKHFYKEQFSARLLGNCSAQTFKQAWQTVVRANDVLRLVYRWEKLEKPVQIVLRNREVPIAVYDYSDHAIEQAEELVSSLKEQDRWKELDLATAPFRIMLCLLNDETSEMVITWHHILFDGWSNGVLLKEFMQAYEAISEGSSLPLKDGIKTPFKQFVQLQQRQNKGLQQQYWKQEFTGWQERTLLTEALESQLERAHEGKGARHTITIPTIAAAEINRYVQQHEVTLAAFLYTAWGILIGRYCRSDDVLFGTTVSGRTPELAGIEEMIGLFINTIPLRMCWKSDDGVSELVNAVNEQLKRRVDYELTPLVDISSYSGADQYGSLFNTIMVIENYPLDTNIGQTGALRIDRYTMVEDTHYGMTIGVQMRRDGELELEFAYDASSFSEPMVSRLANHYREIISQMCSNAELMISEIKLLTTDEHERLLYSFNDRLSPVQMPENQELDTVHSRFEQQVEQTPDRVAVICDERSYTYSEINGAANRLAHRIRALGVCADEPLAIWLDRSEQLLITMLAVLKTGAAYVPIDYDYAPGRINQMLQDCEARILVTTDYDLPEAIAFNGTIVSLATHQSLFDTSVIGDEADNEVQINDAGNQPSINKSNDTAYILYTSGSTGTPKGVVVEHRNLLAYVDAFQHEFRLSKDDTFLQQASPSFDQFVEEVYPVLLAGGQVVIARKTDVIDMPRLVELIDRHQVTIVSVSPLLLNELNKQSGMDSVRIFISGGDVLKTEYMSALLEKADVYNTYGPTEATVCGTYHRCSATNAVRGSIPIGKPILNYRVYVLDPYGHPLPIGVPGEICIAGAGVARGYLNRPELTAQSFSIDPYYTEERMYRTGDIGLWMLDGSLQYVGRNDQQVKIRGYRVEPGDIEYRLLSLAAIDEASVLAHEYEHGMMSLAAYVKTNRDVTANELRNELALSLPAYMIPNSFYHIDSVPMTANGKLDRKALLQVSNRLASDVRAMITDSEASETEKKIVRVWKDVLKVDDVGLQEHFFDLGGNSILLMQLHAKLEKEYAWGIQIVDLFSYTTIARLAQWVDEKQSYKENDDGAVWGNYQQLPATFFHRQMNGSGVGVVRFHLQTNLLASIIEYAESAKVEWFDVLSGMMVYLISEWNGKPDVAIQCLVEGGDQVSPLLVNMNVINGFEGLFQFVHQARKSGNKYVYPIDHILSSKLIKGENDVLPLLYRNQDIEIDAALLQVYDIAWGVEEQTDENKLSISIKFNDKRMKKDAIHTLASGYIDLLRQLTASIMMS
ncbi:amino acid adenylation domain-containing protein [Paenibacillus sp. GSMTC-2017]|nr:amino acid adenylation domain-containing protein [Paenibacillus sp. GSMTC-2017]